MEAVQQDIFSGKPWAVPENKVIVADAKLILRYLTGVHHKKSFLTLVDARGRRYEKSIILDIDKDSFYIDKPPNWNNNISFCYIFFKNEIDTWSFFRLNKIYYNKYSLSGEIPSEIYYLESVESVVF